MQGKKFYAYVHVTLPVLDIRFRLKYIVLIKKHLYVPIHRIWSNSQQFHILESSNNYAVGRSVGWLKFYGSMLMFLVGQTASKLSGMANDVLDIL